MVKQRQVYSFRGPSNTDQMGFYDYSFNNNYLLFQNPPAAYNNFDYSPANPSNYHDYNSLPSYNHFTPATSPIFGSNYRHSNPLSLPVESNKFASQPKAEVSNSDSISLEKLQSIIHNTSEHVQELNQMCQIKEPKEFEKSELRVELIDAFSRFINFCPQKIQIMSSRRRLHVESRASQSQRGNREFFSRNRKSLSLSDDLSCKNISRHLSERRWRAT